MTVASQRLSTALAGRYRIESRLGEGGMATVYLAEDLKHKRKVAVKVLRPELAAVLGAERFVQEITTTANLQHPHILPLFDSGEADSFLYYVMPFIDGETLREKLDRETQLSIEEAVKITTDVADALHYAHGEGVIHRDIKPENILIHNGRPIVADFGIALAVSAAAGGRMTETGLSLGTPHYMSPEQATAERDITSRSDIYSLGAMLYEMLTGDPPHTGSSAQQIIMKIVTEDARPVTDLRKSVPPNVAAATAKALEKLPADRFGSAAALGQALADSSFGIDRVPTAELSGHPLRPGKTITMVWGFSLAVVAALTWTVARQQAPPSREYSPRFHINLDAAPLAFIGEASLGIGRRNLAMSRDGSTIVYVGVHENQGHLFVRALDEYTPTRLSGTAGAYAPFFSPNGRNVAFFVGNELRRTAVDGGDPIVLATVANPMGGDWGANDRIIIAGREGVELLAVAADGGNVEQLYQVNPQDDVQGVSFPNLLPSGKAVLVNAGFLEGIGVVDLETGVATVLRTDGTGPRYIGSETIVYVVGSTLLASRFDEANLTLVGQSVPVLNGVRTEVYGVGQWATSDRGDLVYAPGQAVAEGALTWLTSNGVPDEVLEVSVRRHGTFELSPDGGRLAIEVFGAENAVWMYDLVTGGEQKLSLTGNGFQPDWSADGTQVMFGSDRSSIRQHYVRTVDAGDEEQRVLSVPDDAWVFSWSPDGAFVVLGTTTKERSALTALELETGEFHPIHESAGSNWGGVISPDGRAVAYTSDETGEYHVYVAPFPSTGLRRIVSREGGAEEPIWAPSGDRLYYRNGQRLMSVTVRWTPGLDVGPPTLVFERDWVNLGGRSYDVSPDGRRFLVIDPPASSATTLNVVMDWFAEVQRRLDDGGQSGNR